VLGADKARHLLGVDVGGTFTDAALIAEGRLLTAKVPTTPADQSAGVIEAVELVLAGAGVPVADVGRFAHGMTVGTNALLEERGARTALLATEGFTDVLEIARQTRPELYRLCKPRPSPLVPAELRFGVRERMGPREMISPLDEEALAGMLDQVAEAGVEAVAISLLHSYSDPAHERRVAEAVAERLPGTHVSASHEVLGVFREYERTSTTVIDAYLSPLLGGYLEKLAARAAEAGLPAPEIMQSSGGLWPAATAARHAAWTVLSGPAAGAVGAAYLGSLSGSDDVLSFDMGGTSCDVAVVDRGKVRQTPERTIGGRVLQLPMVDVHTVGAGGGSIGWADAGGALRVGPQSAGAEPGPACYGRGGTDATVTDANLQLGYLDTESSLAGGLRLDAEAAERALGKLGGPLGLSTNETASGIARVADQEMIRALRVVTVERGVDPRNYALVAFGGAGPMHAARIAEELEIERVLFPRAAGVLSALGLVVSHRRRDFARSVLLSGADLSEEGIGAAVSSLIEAARKEMPGARAEVSYDVRYQGQAFELTIEGSERADPAELRGRFERAHEERYGYADAEAELELVNVRVAAIERGAKPDLAKAGGPTSPGEVRRCSRPASFGGERLETAVTRGELPPGERIEGPAVLELPEATAVVPPGWRGHVRDDGTLVLERGGAKRRGSGEAAVRQR
jgi:N-methylhydantoinase A